MAGEKATITFKSASTDSITIGHDGSGWNIPSDTKESEISWGSWKDGDLTSTRTGTSTWTAYSEGTTTWSWVFYGKTENGSYSQLGKSSDKTDSSKEVSGFGSGSKCSIYGILSATRSSKLATRTYTQGRTRTKTEIKDSEGNGTGTYEYSDWVEGSVAKGSLTYSKSSVSASLGPATSNTLNFYTRPTTFYWSKTPTSGQIIEDYLSYSDWNNLMDKAVQKYNWKNCQPGSSKSAKATPQNHVSQKSWITADIYNAGATLCGLSTSVVACNPSSNIKGTLISASLFTALSTAVNSNS